MRFNIKYKLFAAMILANIFVIAAIYFLSSWSFSASFKEYLDANRAQALSPLVTALADKYAQTGSWQWMNDRGNPTWRDLVDTHYRSKFDPEYRRERINAPPRGRRENKQPQRPPPNSFQGPDRRPPPKAPPRFSNVVSPRFLLADREHQLIIGRPNPEIEVVWLEILNEQTVVGYLGYHATTEISDEIDRVFLEKLQRNFSWSFMIILLVSALVTLALSRLMVQPILNLRRIVHKMGKGDFSEKITVTSQDELGELSNDVNRMAESLDKNLKARQQWVADISHELRTPVAILQGELEALQDGVRPVSTKAINSLHQEIKRLSFLIHDLHELSLSDIGALNYHFETVDLVEIVDDLIDSQQSRVANAISITHKKPDSTIKLEGDPQRLMQMLINLLNNSLAYSDHPGKVEIDYKITSDQVIFNWSDSAPGVSETQLAKLFDRLYRAESSRNRNLGGSGLGLSIVRNIIEAHSGNISASHASLGGVTFSIRLPLK